MDNKVWAAMYMCNRQYCSECRKHMQTCQFTFHPDYAASSGVICFVRMTKEGLAHRRRDDEKRGVPHKITVIDNDSPIAAYLNALSHEISERCDQTDTGIKTEQAS